MVHGAIYQLLAEKSPGFLGNIINLTFEIPPRRALRCVLISRIHWLVSESELPRKVVNVLLAITDSNIKSAVVWGS